MTACFPLSHDANSCKKNLEFSCENLFGMIQLGLYSELAHYVLDYFNQKSKE